MLSALRVVPKASNNRTVMDLEDAYLHWKGLPKITEREAARYVSSIGGQGIHWQQSLSAFAVSSACRRRRRRRCHCVRRRRCIRLAASAAAAIIRSAAAILVVQSRRPHSLSAAVVSHCCLCLSRTFSTAPQPIFPQSPLLQCVVCRFWYTSRKVSLIFNFDFPGHEGGGRGG